MQAISIFSSKVLETKDLTSDVKFLRLSVPKDFNFKAGQYLSLSVMRSDGKKIRKPFSISNAPGKKGEPIDFCAKLIPGGLASEYIKALKRGDEVELFGPAGKFVVTDSDKDLVFIASGVGIAPFTSMIPDLLRKNPDRKIILLKSSRTEADSLYDSPLEELSNKYPNFAFYNIFSNPKRKDLNKGHVQDFFGKYISPDFDGYFYICGLEEMITDSRDKLISMGFKDENIFNERFD